MIATRVRKIARDFGERSARSVLTLLGLSLGMYGVCAVLVAFASLADDLDANYRQTLPPNIVVSTGQVTPELLQRLAAVPGVERIERRDALAARIEIAPQRWMGMTLFVVEDFAQLGVARFYPESGAWPPPPGSVLIEGDGRFFLHAALASSLRVRLPDGRIVAPMLAGYAFDPGQAPSRMEMSIYGYVTRATIEQWSVPTGRARLLIVARDGGAGVRSNGEPPPTGVDPAPVHTVADRVTATLAQAGVPVRRVSASEIIEHPHAFQFRAILVLLAGLAGVSVLMCIALIVNLIDSIMASERRAIGVMKAIGARNAQIARDYLLGIAGLGLVAVLLCLPLALLTGRAIAAFVAAFINFKLLTTNAPAWLIPGAIAFGVLLPVAAAAWRVARATALPVREALAHTNPLQNFRLADGFGWLLCALPVLPRMALHALARKPQRSVLTALTLTLGLVFFLIALNLRSSLLETVASVQRTKPHDLAVTFRDAYPIEQLDPWIRAFPNVRSAEFWSSVEATLSADGRGVGQPTPVLAPPSKSDAIRPDLIAGTWLQDTSPNGIVVTQKLLADVPQLQIGARYQLHANYRSTDATIIGVVREFGPGLIYAPAALLDRLVDRPGRSNLMLVTLKDSSFVTQRKAASLLEENLVGSDWQVGMVLTTGLLAAIVRSHLDVIQSLLLLIAGMALFIGAMGLASSISVSVVERYREVGVLKAIGGSSAAIALLFACEAVFIALLGWMIALLAAPWLSRSIVASFGNLVIQYPFDYRAAGFGGIAAFGVAVAIALFASSVPIAAGLRTTTQHALRTE